MSQETQKKPKIIKADTSLQQRIGTGPLNPNLVDRAEIVMKSQANIDFAPVASDFLRELSQAIEDCKAGKYTNKKEAMAAVTAPVMQLKANSKTFGYDLIGDMANVMLNFVETIREVDKDVIEILQAHHTTLNAIVVKKIKGTGGDYGRQMTAELQGACRRYIAKINA